ncbi:hypothetical protein VOLCADRAFT_107393 [Volvox carteri f. nagariensis]|uniref:Uncharacterized protein n=1 Tax=Volvox carteri f. nagariensis TaxID=3068 RepID=D8UDQ8_VOLCA|nr:uncharacterized protein VOLCADRAFT_107393 [Volvox carteri f. nagariensis]EFJ42085.1 hypothetical protein VOLCADRAFT_107393 [Volvox carteri f. nagariensis]|eukprot:XP_002956782.1 hypothetical protein VOLCADRAFT_107393 [Volvox carteri f. nagariensis]
MKFRAVVFQPFFCGGLTMEVPGPSVFGSLRIAYRLTASSLSPVRRDEVDRWLGPMRTAIVFKAPKGCAELAFVRIVKDAPTREMRSVQMKLYGGKEVLRAVTDGCEDGAPLCIPPHRRPPFLENKIQQSMSIAWLLQMSAALGLFSFTCLIAMFVSWHVGVLVHTMIRHQYRLLKIAFPIIQPLSIFTPSIHLQLHHLI